MFDEHKILCKGTYTVITIILHLSLTGYKDGFLALCVSHCHWLTVQTVDNMLRARK